MIPTSNKKPLTANYHTDSIIYDTLLLKNSLFFLESYTVKTVI
jgi:hypothetical protein